MTRPLSPKPSTALARASSTRVASDEVPALLAEALHRAEQTRNTVEDALVDFGRWLLVHVFDDDTNAALGDARQNALWTELLRRAGGPTLRLSRRFLHVAVAIAAHDKRINDDAWRLLEPGRKEILLPLADEKIMRKAAAHVVKLKLSQRSTRSYVNSLRREQGAPAKSRVSGERARADITRFLARASDAQYEKRLHATLKKMDPEARKDVLQQAAALRSFAERLSRAAKAG